MKISLSGESFVSSKVDLLAVGVYSPKPDRDPNVLKLDRAAGGAIEGCIKEGDFTGKRGETVSLLGRGRIRAKRVLLVGLGPKARQPLQSTNRLLAVKAARAAQNRSSLAVVAPGDASEVLRALAEGIATGAYRYTRFLTGGRKPKRSLRRAFIFIGRAPDNASREAVGQGAALGDAVNLTRDLVNCPANELGPAALAEAAAEQCRNAGIKCKVYDKKGIEKLGMPLLLAVNRGSGREPRFVHMTYQPGSARGTAPRVVFVGKGLTFDAGGLCIKPPASMTDMKCDMAGAAATIGIVAAAARLGLPVEVHGIVAATDNMTGPDAYRPGDVFPSREGKTVEIINTDAEGRLVLADALAYASELKPTYLVDHATLTGACMVALGNYRCGLFSNSDELADRYLEAARVTGESYWRMPLDDELREELKSQVADIKHTGSRMGGAISAALFLQEFVGKRRWVHLDIAGPAFLEKPHGVLPRGGTGFGVLTAVRFLESLV